MQEPSGVSGVQARPKSRQSVGFLAPRRIAVAFAGLVAFGGDIGLVEASLGVEGRELVLQAQRSVGDVAEAAPFEVARSSNTARHRLLGLEIAVAGDRTDILVLDFGAALVELPHQHQNRLQDVDRLEAGDRDRLAVLLGENS